MTKQPLDRSQVQLAAHVFAGERVGVMLDDGGTVTVVPREVAEDCLVVTYPASTRRGACTGTDWIPLSTVVGLSMTKPQHQRLERAAKRCAGGTGQ